LRHSIKSHLTIFSEFFVLAIPCLIVFLAGCGGSSNNSGSGTTSTGTGTGTSTQPSISLSRAPTSVAVDGTFSITATVTDDSGNSGVTWSCTPASTCGSFSAAKTASGTATTYTAPATVPSSTVVITATLVDNAKITASTSAITVKAATTIAAISVALSTPPPAAVAPGGTATIAATVTNDSAKKGVIWSCTPASTCGSFSPTSTASTVNSTYTAGTSIGNVTITATSVSDAAAAASALVTVTSAAGATLAPGYYAFSMAGTDVNQSNYFVAGVFQVSSPGLISSGEQDFSDRYSEEHDNISSGTIVASTSKGDSNLTVTLQTGDPCIGAGATTTCTGGSGTEVLDVTLVSSSHGLLIEDDAWASSSGTIDAQTSTSALCPTGSSTSPCAFAFFLNGIDDTALPMSIGGVINIDNSGGAGGISGNGSVFDQNDAGAPLPDQLFTTSGVTSPDSFGYVQFGLNPSTITSTVPGELIVAGYIVDGIHVRLVEQLDAFEATTGGTAILQTGAGTFSNTSISGSSYVFGNSGYDFNGPLQAAGSLTFNSDGSVAGNLSFNDWAFQSPQGGSSLAAEVLGTPCSSGGAPTPCYTIDGPGTGNDGGTGRVTVTNITDSTSSPSFTYNYELYLTGDGNALALSLDSTDVQSGPGYLQTGPFTAASFAGSYVLNIDQQDTAGSFEYDGVGTSVLNGVGNFTGYLDLTGILSSFLDAAPDDLLAGTFTANTSGVFTGSVQGISTTSGSTQDGFTYYLVDPTKAVAIESDTDQLTLGLFELQQ
jgi:hypothetical protein